MDTGPPLRAGLCLAKGSRLQARARPARPMPRQDRARQPLCADIDGFSLHAAARVEAHDRKRLEHAWQRALPSALLQRLCAVAPATAGTGTELGAGR